MFSDKSNLQVFLGFRHFAFWMKLKALDIVGMSSDRYKLYQCAVASINRLQFQL